MMSFRFAAERRSAPRRVAKCERTARELGARLSSKRALERLPILAVDTRLLGAVQAHCCSPILSSPLGSSRHEDQPRRTLSPNLGLRLAEHGDGAAHRLNARECSTDVSLAMYSLKGQLTPRGSSRGRGREMPRSKELSERQRRRNPSKQAVQVNSSIDKAYRKYTMDKNRGMAEPSTPCLTKAELAGLATWPLPPTSSTRFPPAVGCCPLLVAYWGVASRL